MSYDLILQTHPNRDFAARDLETIQQDIGCSTTLQRLCEVIPGRLGASNIDVLVLGEGLDFGDFSERDFTDFCSRRGLPVDRQHQDSAAAFVRSQLGFAIATFKLPMTDAEARVAYAEIVQLAIRYGLRVTDPQKGDDVDLQEPGFLPPKWSA
jgi:hypothetical protein